MNSCVVIPAFNEAGAIASVVAGVLPFAAHVVVIDDGSSDATAARAHQAGATVIRHAVNLGQGAALQTGFEYALAHRFAEIVTFDADGQMQPEDIPSLLEPIGKGYDIALGSRFKGQIEGATWTRRLFLHAAVHVSNGISGLRLSDAHCGLRALSAQAAQKIRLQQAGMAHASELLRQVRKHGLRHIEVPVTIRYTAYSMSKGQSWLHALKILWDLFSR